MSWYGGSSFMTKTSLLFCGEILHAKNPFPPSCKYFRAYSLLHVDHECFLYQFWTSLPFSSLWEHINPGMDGITFERLVFGLTCCHLLCIILLWQNILFNKFDKNKKSWLTSYQNEKVDLDKIYNKVCVDFWGFDLHHFGIRSQIRAKRKDVIKFHHIHNCNSCVSI